MANLTLALDDDVLRRARIRALERGTSVNAVVREYLEGFAGDGPGSRGLREFLARAERISGRSPGTERSWTREELYERVEPG